MPCYRLTIAYDGTDFHGWQRQEPPGQAPLRTVQGTLEEAARAVVAEPIHVVGASRTDAGVHAIGQVAALETRADIPPNKLPLALNARLPADVQVTHAAVTASGFDPISEATSKCYRYTFAHPTAEQPFPPIFERRYVCWHFRSLEVAAMRDAGACLVGEHDFTAFAHAVHTRETPVRRVHQCVVSQPAPGRVAIDISGNGFLYNMVRVIAGTLLDVGRGRKSPAEVADALRSRDRSRAGQTMPAQGLCLRWVHYAPEGDRAASRTMGDSLSEPPVE